MQLQVPLQAPQPQAASAAPTGAYNPDTGRKISRLPAYMEIIRESERRKMLALASRTLLDRYVTLAKQCTRRVGSAAASMVVSTRPGGSGSGRGATSRNGGSGGIGGGGGGTDAAAEGPTQEELTEEGKCLCRDYICHRLQRSGVMTQKLLNSLTHSSGGSTQMSGPSETSQELRMAGEQLETMYPDLYKNVHKQLNITMNSEEIVRRTYTMFAEHLCSNGVHWGKVVALFAMAGAFAVDCVQQGHQEYVAKIVDSFGSFVSSRLCDWLGKQGGWVIPEITRNAKRENDRTWFWLLLSVGALVLFVATLLISASL